MKVRYSTILAQLISYLRRAFRCLASRQLAVGLIVSLMVVLVVATALEAMRGMAYAHWFVYDSPWFLALLILLAIHILCAAAIRVPWKRHHIGTIITYSGLLVLLAGAAQSFYGGIAGQISFAEGETATGVTAAELSQITAAWANRADNASCEYRFRSGPVDWPAGRKLDLGEIGAVRVRVLQFIAHALPVEQWIPDGGQSGGPRVKFKIIGPERALIAENYLADEQFGDVLLIGPMRLQLERAYSDAMLADFLAPPSGQLGERGLLHVYYQDVVYRLPVKENVGQRLPLGNTGAAIEIAGYLANACPDRIGQFFSKDEQPQNPMLELRVHLPGAATAQRQIAFAKNSLLNLDSVHGRVSPVKFRFYHPAVTSGTAVELMRGRNGKLFGRICAEGRFTIHGEVRVGDPIKISDNLELLIAEYQPYMQKEIRFEPARAAANLREKFEPAALVEITAAGTTQTIWLQRTNQPGLARMIETPNGPIQVRYDHGELPLGFALRLVQLRDELNQGPSRDAAVASIVQIVDPAHPVESPRMISMNKPLTHRNISFYQSSVRNGGHGRRISALGATYDPGRTFKYSGSLMVGLGIAIMFYRRARHSKD